MWFRDLWYNEIIKKYSKLYKLYKEKTIMKIVEKYFKEIENKYKKLGCYKNWSHFWNLKEGVSEKNREELLSVFPDAPESLLEMLDIVDGTYWREYAGEKFTQYLFGSDVDDGEYPYYLLSTREIIDDKDITNNFSDFFYYAIEEPDEKYGPFLDKKISTDVNQLKWIHFSDCMNNGGTSKLFIDLTPSETGKKGQIVRYFHDPDELKVIADSFDSFLEMLIKKEMIFLHEDDFE